MRGSKLEKLGMLMEEARAKKNIWMMLVIHDEMKKIKSSKNIRECMHRLLDQCLTFDFDKMSLFILLMHEEEA